MIVLVWVFSFNQFIAKQVNVYISDVFFFLFSRQQCDLLVFHKYFRVPSVGFTKNGLRSDDDRKTNDVSVNSRV